MDVLECVRESHTLLYIIHYMFVKKWSENFILAGPQTVSIAEQHTVGLHPQSRSLCIQRNGAAMQVILVYLKCWANCLILHMQMSTVVAQVQAGTSKFNSMCTISLPQLSLSPSLCWLSVLFCSLRAKSLSLVTQQNPHFFLFGKTKSGFVWCCSLKCVSLA